MMPYRLLTCLLLSYAIFAVGAVEPVPNDSVAWTDTLAEIVVEGTTRGNFLNSSALEKREIISSRGLAKLACCTLAESFENSASVSVGYSDAVSGSRQIRLLGLAGTYTQMLDESRPFMCGLSAPYALDYTPGAWLKSIQVSKGVASVTAGHDAIAGQINLEYRKPTDEERLFANVYFDDMLRPELNLATAFPLTADKRLSTIVLLHGSADTDWREMSAMDRNGDGFRDMPDRRQIDVANRWTYLAPGGLQLRWGARFTAERRFGGQMHYAPGQRDEQLRYWPFTDAPAPDDYTAAFCYGTRAENRDAGAYLKIGLPTHADDDTPAAADNVALLADVSHFDTRSYYGLNDYNAHENALNIGVRYDHHFTAATSLAAGASLHWRRVDEYVALRTLADGQRLLDLSRNDREAGAYAEITVELPERLTVVAGLRIDQHFAPQRHLVLTPRALLKWNLAQRTVLRLSLGSGHRLPNPVSEHLGLLATGRRVIIVTDDTAYPELRSAFALERALTIGGSLTQTFTLGRDANASLSADYFFTRFSRSTIVDEERNAGEVWLYGLNGGNRSHTWQLDFNWQPLTGFDVLAAARFTNSRLALPQADGTVVAAERPLVGRFKALLSLSYATRFRVWVFDATVQAVGPARIPQAPVADALHSPTYCQLMAQVTYKVGRADLYFGCENITDYRQRDPITAADAPFSPDFNTMNVWGPLMGRRFYIGMRLNLY